MRPTPDAAAYADEMKGALSQARDFQDVLDIVRRWRSAAQALRKKGMPE